MGMGGLGKKPGEHLTMESELCSRVPNVYRILLGISEGFRLWSCGRAFRYHLEIQVAQVLGGLQVGHVLDAIIT